MTADNIATTTPTLDDPITPTMKNPALERSMAPTPRTSTRKTAALVGLAFLTATFTFAIGNALIHSYFSSATSHNGTLIAGVVLLGVDGVAVVTNGLAMRRVLTPHAPIRSQAYFILRVAECVTVVAIGVYFLMSQSRWDAYVLPVYAVSGAAGLVLSSALLTSRIVPRSLSMLGASAIRSSWWEASWPCSA